MRLALPLFAMLFLGGLSAGCSSSDADASGQLVCGTGTVQEGRECVPGAENAAGQAAGSHAGASGQAGAAGSTAGGGGKTPGQGGAGNGQSGAGNGQSGAGHAQAGAGSGGTAGAGQAGAGQAGAGLAGAGQAGKGQAGSAQAGSGQAGGGTNQGGAGHGQAGSGGAEIGGMTGAAGLAGQGGTAAGGSAGGTGGAGATQEIGYGGLPIPAPGGCSASVAAQDPLPADNAIDPTFNPLDLGWDRNWESSLLSVRYRQEDLCRPTPDFDHHSIHNLAEAKASDGTTDFEACEYGTDFFWCDSGPNGCTSPPFDQLDTQGKKDWINNSCGGKWKPFTKPADGGAPYYLHRQQHGAWFLAARATNRPDTVTTMIGTGDATHVTNSSCNNLMDGSHRNAPRQGTTGTPQIRFDESGHIAVQSVKGAIVRLYRVGGADEASKIKDSVRLDSVLVATDGTATFCAPGGAFDGNARYVVSAQQAGEQESFMMNAVSLDANSAPARLQLEVVVTPADESLQPPPGYQSRWYQPKPELPPGSDFEIVSTANKGYDNEDAHQAYYATLSDMVAVSIVVKSGGNPVPFAIGASNFAYGVVPVLADAWNLWAFLPKATQDAMTRTPQEWQDYEAGPWSVDWGPNASQAMKDSLTDASPKILWLPKGRSQHLDIRVNPADPTNYQVTAIFLSP